MTLAAHRLVRLGTLQRARPLSTLIVPLGMRCEVRTVPELIALPSNEVQAYIDALSDEDKIALREASIDWLVDELKFVIVHGTRRGEK